MIGQDGYLRYQLETVFGTPVTSSMTLLPIKEGSLLKGYSEMIENTNIIGSRVKQDPDLGRTMVPVANLLMDWYPDLAGGIINWFLGASNGDTDNTDGSYTHNWLTPITGVRVAKSATCQQAVGSDLADQFAGSKIVAIILEGDTTGNTQVTLEVLSKSFTEDVARISTFVYPTTIPFNWSFATFVPTPSGGSPVDICVKSFNLRIDLGYDLEHFCFGSREINNPTYTTIPSSTLTMSIEADRTFLKNARIHKKYSNVLTFTSTEDAGTSTKYNLVVELPGCILSPEIEIPNSNDKLLMDLEFDCGYGGTTTNSGTSVVMSEIRLTDTVATYT